MFPDLVRDDVFRLETRRMWLRWPRARDADALARVAACRDIAEKTPGLRYPLPEGGVAEFILTSRKSNALGRGLALVLTPKQDPTAPVGCILSKPVAERADRGVGDGAEPAGDRAEGVAFWLARHLWGQGLMSEALRAFADLVFGLTDLDELTAEVGGLNPIALRVLTKAGFLPGGGEAVERFRLERMRWSRDHGLGAADAQNAMSVLRARA